MLELNRKNSITVGNSEYAASECGGFTYALFPAFLKALYYSPENLSGKGESYFGIGNWYIPDSKEVERLIYYRINSSITSNASSEVAWNNITASNRDVSDKGLNVFNSDTFANIAYLSYQGWQITSESTLNGEALMYGKSSWESGYPQWYISVPSWEPSRCARDLSYNVSPVCRIVLVES